MDDFCCGDLCCCCVYGVGVCLGVVVDCDYVGGDWWSWWIGDDGCVVDGVCVFEFG